jgi:hypothetical protein
MRDATICFGAIFYFFADPALHRQALRSAMLLWKECWTTPFTRMSRSGDSFRSFPKAAPLEQLLERLYDPHDFDHSLFFTFFDGDSIGETEAQLLFWGATIDERWKLKTPNYLYIQTSAGTELEQCWRLFKQTAALFPVHLALGNYMVTCNPEAQPGSGAAACRHLRQSPYLLHEFDTSFRSDGFLRLLERRNERFLLHPSQFVYVGEELASFCRPAVDAAQSCSGELMVEPIARGQAVRVCSDAGLGQFSTIFAPHYGAVVKPAKFWKDPEWHLWLTKMQSSQPGRLFSPTQTA